MIDFEQVVKDEKATSLTRDGLQTEDLAEFDFLVSINDHVSTNKDHDTTSGSRLGIDGGGLVSHGSKCKRLK